jgi:adenosylcobinamide kinase/adenosylcobinamide-phosphate guanylyltransferase
MQKRINNHQNQRDNNWHTIEEPVNFIPHLTKPYTENTVILIDCMTIWLSNVMEKSLSITDMTDTLLNNLSSCSADVILVSNELGLSIVPENALARAFRDEQGLLNQKLAKRATNVVFIAAGLPLILK